MSTRTGPPGGTDGAGPKLRAASRAASISSRLGCRQAETPILVRAPGPMALRVGAVASSEAIVVASCVPGAAAVVVVVDGGSGVRKALASPPAGPPR